jgi:uncharacterized phage protein (TIGR01671 family)
MRELKFRVWYDKSQCWIYFNLNKGFTDFGLKLYRELIVNGAKFYQFTGLKDMNGKEIYDKDIIKCFPSGIYGVVEWIEQLGTFTLQTIGNEYDTTVYGTQIEGKNITREVVGNVYENPEYL